jgi:hypothetical protein
MIVSASYRTDIPAFYGDWFLGRLEAGACEVANPYGGPAYRVPLVGPEAEGFVFWTRNIAPFGAALEAVAARGLPFVVHYTITGYPRALEASVIPAARSVALVRALAARYGPRAVVWRYDPLLITSLTPPAWHRKTFAGLAAALAGATDEVVLSFAQVYRKTRANTERAARQHGFTWHDPAPAEKRALLAELAGLARAQGLKASLCAQPELLDEGLGGAGLRGGGLQAARCIDAGRLSDVAGRVIEVRTKGNRPGCLCAQSRDIGAYDTCPHGCVYCYAVSRPEAAKRRHRVIMGTA